MEVTLSSTLCLSFTLDTIFEVVETKTLKGHGRGETGTWSQIRNTSSEPRYRSKFPVRDAVHCLKENHSELKYVMMI